MYIELHARSAFSFLEGASNPEDLIEACAALDMPAMALVDTDNVCGAPRFYMAAKKAGIRAHIGAEITAQSGGRYVLLAENRLPEPLPAHHLYETALGERKGCRHRG
jgi:error-prone DNA polymerase